MTVLSAADQNLENQPVVIVSRHGRALVLTLNRPRALNALDFEMIRLIDPALVDAATDPAIDCVIIEGAGGKAFCAGGDIRAAALSLKQQGSTLAAEFFAAEYRLNQRINRFPKPFIALIDGVSMGGGLGLSMHGSHRVVTERLLAAMPETSIGLFPDIGAGWFLPKWPGYTGRYAALTGARLDAADALFVGYATACVASADLPALRQALLDQPPATREEATTIIATLAHDPGPSKLAAEQADIDAWFAADTMEEIVSTLERSGTSRAKSILDTLAKCAPASMKVALRLLTIGATLNLEEDLVLEYRLSQHCMARPDFSEGVRALLIDKDQSPKWQPATLEQATDALIQSYFDPLSGPDLTFPAYIRS